MTPKERAAMQQALDVLENLPALSWIPEKERDAFEAITALREALDHIADAGKVIPQFIPVGIVNDHHSITWMEEKEQK